MSEPTEDTIARARREGAREGWDAALHFLCSIGIQAPWPRTDAERARRYSPLAAPPAADPGVTLSDGSRYRHIGNRWLRFDGAEWLAQVFAPSCRTPDDYGAVARYLRWRV